MTIDVSRWTTPAEYFPWVYVQEFIDQIDFVVHHISIAFAQEEFALQAHACPTCARPAVELFWFSASDPEAAWEAKRGRTGFLTVCTFCRRQVDFFVDLELTEMDAAWRLEERRRKADEG